LQLARQCRHRRWLTRVAPGRDLRHRPFLRQHLPAESRDFARQNRLRHRLRYDRNFALAKMNRGVRFSDDGADLPGSVEGA
jgi:hypothetical protein